MLAHSRTTPAEVADKLFADLSGDIALGLAAGDGDALKARDRCAELKVYPDADADHVCGNAFAAQVHDRLIGRLGNVELTHHDMGKPKFTVFVAHEDDGQGGLKTTVTFDLYVTFTPQAPVFRPRNP